MLAAFAHPRHALYMHSGGGVSAFAALPKSKLVRVYSAWSNFVEKARAVTFVSSLNVYKEQAEEIKSQAQ